MNEREPQTLIEAVQHFADADTCHQYMLGIKWPDGKITCPACGSEKVGEIATRRMLECRNAECLKQFSAKVSTIFEDSKLPLSKWFVAVWLIANAKNGVSSLELHRAIKVTQKTAWFMLHRIRLAMQAKSFKLSGAVESDETFIGGAAANMHAKKRERKILGRGAVGKAIVHGLLQRTSPDGPSQVNAAVVNAADQETLGERVAANVAKGATVYTDAAQSYSNLYLRYVHQWVDHARAYVNGLIHTNGMESLVKRMLRGTYVSVAPFHLQRYLDEEAWRFNQRKLNDGDRFRAVMRTVLGKRLTFRELCAIDDCGFMGIK